MVTLWERLHEAGYKFTTPRRLVAQVIEKEHEHLTANEIWERVRHLDSTIGRMSVYRTLDLFTQVGYIRPTTRNLPDGRSGVVYVILYEGHHHHIVCQQCNRVIEFEDCGLEDLIHSLENTYGCAIGGHLLEFFGICSQCRESKTKTF
jgi:Fur family transcriptional regulator, ferric uptake regulator